MFSDDMTVYVESLKELTKQKQSKNNNKNKNKQTNKQKKEYLKLLSHDSKVAEYKVNVVQSIVFLYTSINNGIWKLKKNTIYPKEIKYYT